MFKMPENTATIYMYSMKLEAVYPLFSTNAILSATLLTARSAGIDAVGGARSAPAQKA